VYFNLIASISTTDAHNEEGMHAANNNMAKV